MTEQAPTRAETQASISLYPLTFVDEGDHVVIGRPEIDSFGVFPPDAAAVVARLRDGADLDSVARWYREEYGEPADIADFVETLRELDFVRPKEAQAEEPHDTGSSLVRWQRLAAVLLSGPALGLYALVAAVAVGLIAAVPALRPVPSATFFSRYLVLVLVVLTAAQLAGIALHEAFHVLAGRRLGLPSRLSVGRRLYFIVFETTLVGLMSVPARKRILPFCAGLIADTLCVSILVILAGISRLAAWPPEIGRVALALTYITLLRMLWQAMIFMETDLYHVLASVLRCPDLHRITRDCLRSRLAHPIHRVPPKGYDSWTQRERTIVRWYAPVVVVGSAALIGLAALTIVPVLTGLAERIYRSLSTSSLASPQLWDALIAAVLIAAQFAVPGILTIRDRRRRHGRARRETVTT
jgi:hypothetical protein